MVIVALVDAESGPVFPATSVPEFEASETVTVPSEQPLTLTSKTMLSEVATDRPQPVAVPDNVKFEAMIPVTLSANVYRYTTVDALVGVDGFVTETVGAAESTRILLWLARDSGEFSAGNVVTALFLLTSLMVAEPKTRDVVEL